MIDKQKLEKEDITFENGRLAYIDTFLDKAENKEGILFFGIMPNNEKIEISLNNDMLILYKEYKEDGYSIYEYIIRSSKIHNKILIKSHKKIEVFLTNTKKEDTYILIDKGNSTIESLLETIKNNIELEENFHLIEESIINNFKSILKEEKIKTYIKKRQ